MSTPRPRLSRHARWASPPLFAGDWQDLPLHRALPFLLALHKHLGGDGAQLFAEGWPTRVRVTQPSFYPGWMLAEIQIARRDHSAGLAMVLCGASTAVVIGGTAIPIYSVAQLEPPRLTTATAAADYLRFFCSAVHGDDGRFAVLESIDELAGRGLRRPSPPLPTRVSNALKPLRVRRKGEAFHARTLIRYGKNVAVASFAIKPNGHVEMLDDETLCELALTPEVFRAPFWIVPPPSASVED